MDKKDKALVIIACILFFTLLCTGGTAVHYKNKYTRLVEQHRMELELSRERAAVLTDTLTRAREEVGAIGESLSRQRTSVSELRVLIREVKEGYTKMEELLNSSWDDDSGARNIDICTNSSTGEQVE